MTGASASSMNLNVTGTDASGDFTCDAKWGIEWTFFFIREAMLGDLFKSLDLLLA